MCSWSDIQIFSALNYFLKKNHKSLDVYECTQKIYLSTQKHIFVGFYDLFRKYL